MAESEGTTLEEAMKCPRCGKTGEKTREMPSARPGCKVHVITCKTPLCVWFETDYFIQVNADGTIPPPQDHRADKQYPLASPELEERITENIKRQIEAETSGGGEIRNPHA